MFDSIQLCGSQLTLACLKIMWSMNYLVTNLCITGFGIK